MSNSDNVVRGGLTPKYKDTETLFNMLPYDSMNIERTAVSGSPYQSTKSGTAIEYKTGFEEFRVFKVETQGDAEPIALRFSTFTMAVVVKREGAIDVEGFGKFKVHESCAYYIMPEREFRVSGEGLTVFLANCDI